MLTSVSYYITKATLKNGDHPFLKDEVGRGGGNLKK